MLAKCKSRSSIIQLCPVSSSACNSWCVAVLVLVFVVYNRRREAQIKYPGPEDDVRENIINYEDEGGGEDDMTAFDITPLQIPIADPALAHHSLPRQKVHCKSRSRAVFVCVTSGCQFNICVFMQLL